MQTAFTRDNKKVTFITQQYIVGLYVAVYKEGEAIPAQTTSRLKEIAFHKKLRKNNPDFIKEESSILPGKVSKRRSANVGEI